MAYMGIGHCCCLHALRAIWEKSNVEEKSAQREHKHLEAVLHWVCKFPGSGAPGRAMLCRTLAGQDKD